MEFSSIKQKQKSLFFRKTYPFLGFFTALWLFFLSSRLWERRVTATAKYASCYFNRLISNVAFTLSL